MIRLNNIFEIIIDNREQLPVLYDKVGHPDFPELSIEFGTLKTGDYSIVGMDDPECQHSITVERKSLPDLFQSTGRDRYRFEREFIRMQKFDYAALVIEADYKTIFLEPPTLSQMLPKSVFRTVLAFSQRYNVHCFPCPSRSFAEKAIYLILKRFWDDRQENGKMEFCKI